MGRAKWKQLSKKQIQTVIENYVIKKQGLATCGKEFNLSQKSVETLLKDNFIKKRNYTEAKQEGRKYKCNDNFFKYQNSNMAYILGLLASDGNISKKENLITIELLSIDRNILEQIKIITNSEREIKDYIKSSTNQKVSKFCVWSKSWKDDLAHYNIIPNKTFNLKPPSFLDDKFFMDFLRGYFDGDGTIVPRAYGGSFEIVGVSKEIMDWFVEKLANNYAIIPNYTKTKNINGTIIYKLSIGNKELLKKLYLLLYEDKDALYLKRKQKIFNSLVTIPRDSNTLEKV